MLIIIWTNVWC